VGTNDTAVTDLGTRQYGNAFTQPHTVPNGSGERRKLPLIGRKHRIGESVPVIRIAYENIACKQAIVTDGYGIRRNKMHLIPKLATLSDFQFHFTVGENLHPKAISAGKAFPERKAFFSADVNGSANQTCRRIKNLRQNKTVSILYRF
jgi:hypothetical protein